jgi:2-polyprenyl-3-methyl-5-hydroxy-6-metoxy-1,4-benzoquinol methylase
MSIQAVQESTDRQATNRQATNTFGDRMAEMLNSAALVMMASMGHRTCLFDTMSEIGPATIDEIASRAELSQRYVREWLGAMVTGNIVEHRPEDGTYVLPAEHAEFLTRKAVPNNMASMCQWVSVLGAAEDHVVDAFKHGQGVPYSAYKRFHHVMAEESAQTTVAGMLEHIVPLVPNLRQNLERGITVLDVGCGAGGALNLLAEQFPSSRFVGYDLCEEAIDLARAEARTRGATNIQFEVHDVSTMSDRNTYGLITAFDAIHDQSHPDRVLVNIHRALQPGGTFLMQDIAASSHVHENMDHPIGPFIYTISCMHCMSVALTNGGMGLGAAWGKEKAIEMLGEAGFKGVRVESLDHDIINYYYITGKAKQ